VHDELIAFQVFGERFMNGFPLPRRWDPFREFHREVGRFLETFEPLQTWRVSKPFPAINLYDAKDRYILTAELPGVAPDQLDLSITGETLTLRGERRRPEGVNEESYRRQERQFGRWSRTVTLPERVDAGKVAAEVAHGILTVNLPKAEEAKPRQISVAVAS
jgi:HSP20 family protein